MPVPSSQHSGKPSAGNTVKVYIRSWSEMSWLTLTINTTEHKICEIIMLTLNIDTHKLQKATSELITLDIVNAWENT